MNKKAFLKGLAAFRYFNHTPSPKKVNGHAIPTKKRGFPTLYYHFLHKLCQKFTVTEKFMRSISPTDEKNIGTTPSAHP